MVLAVLALSGGSRTCRTWVHRARDPGPGPAGPKRRHDERPHVRWRLAAVAQLHDTVDDAPRVGGQRSFRCPIGCRSTDDRPRSLTVARRDLTDLL